MDKNKVWTWVRDKANETLTEENLRAARRTAKEVADIAVPQILHSVNNLVKQGWSFCSDIYGRRYGSAAETVVNFVVLRPILATIGLTQLGWQVVSTAGKCGYKRISEGALPSEDIEKLKRCGLIVMGTAAALYICSDIYDELGLSDVRNEMNEIGYSGIHLVGLDSVDQLDGVTNGMLVDNSSDNLDQIIALGELDEDMPHTHIPSEMQHRDMEMRQVFLEQHGYDHTPEGYEVHHIIPVSEGGADTPDNMVLLSEEDHRQVTAAHQEYYGWGA